MKTQRRHLLLYCVNQRWLGAMKKAFLDVGFPWRIYDLICSAKTETLEELLDDGHHYESAVIVVPSLKIKIGIHSAQQNQIIERVMPLHIWVHIWVIDIKYLRKRRYLPLYRLIKNTVSIMDFCVTVMRHEFEHSLLDLLFGNPPGKPVRTDLANKVFRLNRKYYLPKK